MLVRTFGWTFSATGACLVAAFLYGGAAAVAVTAVLIVLEVSLSFDNAVVNAGVLGRMAPHWQQLFLTLGLLIAVLGMRIVFPVLIVSATAGMSPIAAWELAIAGGGIHDTGSYANVMHEAHVTIAAFGGMFLLLLFVTHFLTPRDVTWLSWVERPLARAGHIAHLPVLVACGILALVTGLLAPADKAWAVVIAGLLGIAVHTVIKAASSRLVSEPDTPGGAVGGAAGAVGKAAFALFLYLEVIDATFSFDGVIGAFAITSDPLVIAIGLGVGALYVRSLTVHLVRRGSLKQYVYMEHGAQWAIGALAVLLLLTMRHEIPQVITGLVGVGFIGAALLSSINRNRRESLLRSEHPADSLVT